MWHSGAGPVFPPPQQFLTMNLSSWRFRMIFWGCWLEQSCRSETWYQQLSTSSTLLVVHWKIKNSHDNAKISENNRNWRILSEISILEKIIPRTKKFLKVLKNGFAKPESFSQTSVILWVRCKHDNNFNNLCIFCWFAGKHFLKTCSLKEATTM